MNSLHILHSEAAIGWGGQEIRVFQESQLLLERGHKVTIVCKTGSPLAHRCQGLTHDRFQWFPLEMKNTLDIVSIIKLKEIIQRVRPDILHTHSSIDSWLVSFCGKMLGLPIVRSRHVSIPIKNYFPKNWIYTFPQRIIASGEVIENIVNQLDGVSKEQVVSIGAGVDLRRFDFGVSGHAVRKEAGVQEGQPLIGKIAVIRGWKGHDIFLDAVPIILERVSNARFLIVGDGPGFDEIREKIKGKGLEDSIKMLGHREDVPEIIAALDVQVQASTAGEGTPQVIPQAFSMKTPVVATRTASLPDILGHGERGILVEPGDAHSLADGILNVLEHSKNAVERSEKAYAFCKKELTVDQMMDRTIAVYEDVLKGFK